ncbi:MAG: hypothetical protein LBF26_03640 [Puniceicoccales bacterium]|nr:hypothetical protein [Puniceicoccales bacterium]
MSTALFALSAVGAGVLLALAFTVGPFIPVLGWVIPAFTGAIVVGGSSGVFLILTLISWLACGPKNGDPAAPVIGPVPAPAPAPVPLTDNPTPEEVRTRLAALGENGTLAVNITKSDYNIDELVKQFAAVTANGVTIGVALTDSSQVETILASASLNFGSKHPTIQVSCTGSVAKAIPLADTWDGQNLDVSGLTFSGEGKIAPPTGTGKALGSVTLDANQTGAPVEALAQNAVKVKITGAGATYAIPESFFGTEQGTEANRAKTFTIVPTPAEHGKPAASTVVTWPENKHVQLMGGGNVHAKIVATDALDLLKPDSDVALSIALTKAGPLDLRRGALAKKPVHIISGVNALTFAATSPSALTCASGAVASVTSVDLTAYTDATLPAVTIVGETAQKGLFDAFSGLTEATMPTNQGAAAAIQTAAAGSKALATVTYPAGSTLPTVLKFPAGATTVNLGENSLSKVAEINLSACAGKVTFKAGPGAGADVGNLKAPFTGLTTLSVNKANLACVSGLPVKPSSGDDTRLAEIRVIGADGFSTTGKLPIKQLVDRAKKVVIPWMAGGANYDTTDLGDDSAVAAANIYLWDGTNEIKVAKLNQLTGATATPPISPIASATIDEDGIVSVVAGRPCYFGTVPDGGAVKKFSADPGSISMADNVIQELEEIPIFQGMEVWTAKDDGTGASGGRLFNAADGSSTIDLTQFPRLMRVAPTSRNEVIIDDNSVAPFEAMEVRTGGGVEVIDLSKSKVETLVVASAGASQLKKLTLSPTMKSMKVGDDEKIVDRVLDLTAFDALRKFTASGADISCIKLTREQLAQVVHLDLRGKDGKHVDVYVDGVVVSDFSECKELQSLAVGSGATLGGTTGIKPPAICRTLILGKGAAAAGNALSIPEGVENFEFHDDIAKSLTGIVIPKGVKKITVIGDGDPVELIKDGKLMLKASLTAALKEAIIGANTDITSVETDSEIDELHLADSKVSSVIFAGNTASKALKVFDASQALNSIRVASGANLIEGGKLTLSAEHFAGLTDADFSRAGSSITALDIRSSVLRQLSTGDTVTGVELAEIRVSSMKLLSLGKKVKSLKFDNSEVITGNYANLGVIENIHVASEAVERVGVDVGRMNTFHVHGDITCISVDDAERDNWIGESDGSKTLTIPEGLGSLEDFAITSPGIPIVKVSRTKVPCVFNPGTASKLVVHGADAFNDCRDLYLSTMQDGSALFFGSSKQDDWKSIRLAANAKVVTGAGTPAQAFCLDGVVVFDVKAFPVGQIPELVLHSGFKELRVPADTTLKDLRAKFGMVSVSDGVNLDDVSVFVGTKKYKFTEVGFNTSLTVVLSSSCGVVDGGSAADILIIGDKTNLTSLTLGPKTKNLGHKAAADSAGASAPLFTDSDGDATLDLSAYTGLKKLDLGGCEKAKVVTVLPDSLESFIVGPALEKFTPPGNVARLKRLDLSGRASNFKIGEDIWDDSNKLNLSNAFIGGCTIENTDLDNPATLAAVGQLLTIDVNDLALVELGNEIDKRLYVDVRLGDIVTNDIRHTVIGIPPGRLIFRDRELDALGGVNGTLEIVLPAGVNVANLADFTVWVVNADGTMTQKHLCELGCNVLVRVPEGGLADNAKFALAGAVGGSKSVTVQIADADKGKIAALDLSHGLIVEAGGTPLISVDDSKVLNLGGFTALTKLNLGRQAVGKLVLSQTQITNITTLNLSTSASTLVVADSDALDTDLIDFGRFTAMTSITGDASKCALLQAPKGGAANCTWTIIGDIGDSDTYDFSSLVNGQTIVLPANQNGKVGKLNLEARIQNSSGIDLTNLSSFTKLTELKGAVGQYDALAGLPSGSKSVVVHVTDALTNQALVTGRVLGKIFDGAIKVQELRFAQDVAGAGLDKVKVWNAAVLPLGNIYCGSGEGVALTDTAKFTGLEQVTVSVQSLRSGAANAFFSTAPADKSTCTIVIAKAPVDATDADKKEIDLAKLHADWHEFAKIKIPEGVASAITVKDADALEASRFDKISIMKDSDLAASSDNAGALLAGMGVAEAGKGYVDVGLGAGANIFGNVDTKATMVQLTGNWGTAKASAAISAANATVTALDISQMTNVDEAIGNGIKVGADANKGLHDVFTDVTHLVLSNEQAEFLDLSKFPNLVEVRIVGKAAIAGNKLVLPASCTRLIVENAIVLNSLTYFTIGNKNLVIQVGGEENSVPVTRLFDGTDASTLHGLDVSKVTYLALPSGLPATGNVTDGFVVPDGVTHLVMDNSALTDFTGTISLPGGIRTIHRIDGATPTTSLTVSDRNLEFMHDTLMAYGLDVRAGSNIICIKDVSAGNASADAGALRAITSRADEMTLCLSEATAKALTRIDVANCNEVKTSADASTFTAVEGSLRGGGFDGLNPDETRIVRRLSGTNVTLDAAWAESQGGNTLLIARTDWEALKSLTLTGNWSGKEIFVVDADGVAGVVFDSTSGDANLNISLLTKLTKLDLKGSKGGIIGISIEPDDNGTDYALSKIDVSGASCGVAGIFISSGAKHGALTISGTSNADFMSFTDRADAITAGTLTFDGCSVLTRLDLHGCKAVNACDLSAIGTIIYVDVEDSGLTSGISIHDDVVAKVQMLISGSIDVKNNNVSIFDANGALGNMAALEVLSTGHDIVLQKSGTDNASNVALGSVKFLQCGILSVDTNGEKIDLTGWKDLAVFNVQGLGGDVKAVAFHKEGTEANSALRVVEIGGGCKVAEFGMGGIDMPASVVALSICMLHKADACDLSAFASLTDVELGLGDSMNGAVTLPDSVAHAKVVGSAISEVRKNDRAISIDISGVKKDAIISLPNADVTKVYVGANKGNGADQERANAVRTNLSNAVIVDDTSGPTAVAVAAAIADAVKAAKQAVVDNKDLEVALGIA